VPIQVIYDNDAIDVAEPTFLDGLIASKKIKKFLRSEGWANVETDPVRGRGGRYEGPERRKKRAAYITRTPQLKPYTEAIEESVTKYATDIVETVREPLLLLDADLIVLSANKSFYNVFKFVTEETLGNCIYDMSNRRWDIPAMRMLIGELVSKNTRIDDYVIEHIFPDIGNKILIINARWVRREAPGRNMIMLAIEDVTGHRGKERQLEELEERYRGGL